MFSYLFIIELRIKFLQNISRGNVMKKKIKSLMENVLGNIVATIILSVIMSLGSVCLVLWSCVRGIFLKLENKVIPTSYWVFCILGIILAVFCIVVTVINIVKISKKKHYPKIQSDVRYEYAISELYFKNREEITCTRGVKFELLGKEKDSIIKQFMWTGTEYIATTLEESSGPFELVDYHRNQPPHGYEVKFDTTKHRGDIVWYKTKTEVSDRHHDMKPFFSHMIKSPTDSLEIRVTAPKGLLKDVTYTIYADIMGEVSISEAVPVQGTQIGDLETFVCKSDKPNLMYNYRLDWKF